MSTACSVNVDMIGIFKSSFDMLKYLLVLSYRAGVALFSLVSREQLAFFTLFLRKNAKFCQKVYATENFRIFSRNVSFAGNPTIRALVFSRLLDRNKPTNRQTSKVYTDLRMVIEKQLKTYDFKFLNSFKCDKKLY